MIEYTPQHCKREKTQILEFKIFYCFSTNHMTYSCSLWGVTNSAQFSRTATHGGPYFGGPGYVKTSGPPYVGCRCRRPETAGPYIFYKSKSKIFITFSLRLKLRPRTVSQNGPLYKHFCIHGLILVKTAPKPKLIQKIL